MKRVLWSVPFVVLLAWIKGILIPGYNPVQSLLLFVFVCLNVALWELWK